MARKVKRHKKRTAKAPERLRKVGPGGTGWIAAQRVKIIRRRGKPAEVLIERPQRHSKKKK